METFKRFYPVFTTSTLIIVFILVNGHVANWIVSFFAAWGAMEWVGYFHKAIMEQSEK